MAKRERSTTTKRARSSTPKKSRSQPVGGRSAKKAARPARRTRPARQAKPAKAAGKARTKRAAPAPPPREVLTIVDEPIEQEEMVPGAHSSLDLNHRKTSVATLADFEAGPVGGPASDAALGAGDMDADLASAASSGDETPGGDNPTPDQDVVDLIGRSLGVEYDDDEELEGAEKIARRDKHRWELDPASSEDYRDRGR